MFDCTCRTGARVKTKIGTDIVAAETTTGTAIAIETVIEREREKTTIKILMDVVRRGSKWNRMTMVLRDVIMVGFTVFVNYVVVKLILSP